MSEHQLDMFETVDLSGSLAWMDDGDTIVSITGCVVQVYKLKTRNLRGESLFKLIHKTGMGKQIYTRAELQKNGCTMHKERTANAR